jgi:drug/metabolite transporter (DMT)-like permease
MSYYAAMAAGILLTGFAQVLMKRDAARHGTWLASFMNWRTLLGYTIFGLVTILNIHALQAIDLKTMSAWVSATYLVVVLLSWKLLSEEIDRRTALGCIFIVLGIIAFNSDILN